MARYRPPAGPRRDDTGRILMTRAAIAHLAHRDVDHVRKTVPAVACDVATRSALLDLDQAEDLLGWRQHRNREPLRPLSS